jgi:tetratricopeptide (TPR) repeat protein
MALLFASLPAASKLFLGTWGFEGAGEIAFFCLILGTYLHLLARPDFRAVPDDAAILDQAIQLAAAGQPDQSIALLTEAIRTAPRLWQAFQYRGQLYLSRPNSVDAALSDFNEAIRLAPHEAHLYVLRGHARTLLGDEASAQSDYAAAAALGGPDDLAAREGPG